MNNFADELEKLSYAMGMNMGEYLSHTPVKINQEAALAGMRDFFAGSARLSAEEYASAMQTLRTRMQQAAQGQAEQLASANAAAEKKFMAENGAREGVKTTASGLQYEVIAEGKGDKPLAHSKVRVHYTGTLLDGTEFDSSVRRGEPAEFGVNQVIAGWTEALQLMSPGSKYRLFIPARLRLRRTRRRTGDSAECRADLRRRIARHPVSSGIETQGRRFPADGGRRFAFPAPACYSMRQSEVDDVDS